MNQIKHSCNLCGKVELFLLIDFGCHPIAKHYLSNRSDRRPTWPVKLYFCEYCGLTQLADSCPAEYLYDNYITLSSWKFQPHAEHEIDILKSLKELNLSSKIIEIGSNDGSFLKHLYRNGYKNLLGIEPAKDAHLIALGNGIKSLNIYLNRETSLGLVKEYGEFDLFISRQNLEHMRDLKLVAKSIQSLVKEDGYILIEVPDFSCNLRTNDYSIWEEHVNYFTRDTLEYFLSLSGVEIIHNETITFSGEGIFIVGRKTKEVKSTLDYVSQLRIQNLSYAQQYLEIRDALRNFLKSEKRLGKKIAVYGAGARVFCLINFMGISSSIDVIVDDQEEKQNKFMPGGLIPIVASDALVFQKIDLCLLGVNYENEEKVIHKHLDWLRSGGEFFSLLPPSTRMLPVLNAS